MKKIVSSCGCAIASIARNAIEPGESVPLEVQLDTTGYSGYINKNITLFLDSDTGPSVIRFVLKATVRHTLTVESPEIDFGQFPTTERPSRTLLVKFFHEEDMPPPVCTRTSLPDWISIAGPYEYTTDELGVKSAWRFTVSITARPNAAEFSHELGVSIPEHNLATSVRIRGLLEEPLQLIPDSIVLEPENGQYVGETLVVFPFESKRPRDFRQISVKASSSAVSLAYSVVQISDARWRLKVSLSGAGDELLVMRAKQHASAAIDSVQAEVAVSDLDVEPVCLSLLRRVVLDHKGE